MKMERYGNFKEELKQRTDHAEKVIRLWLPKEEGFAKTMAEAMNYSMCAGGKRLRPVLLLETLRLFGGDEKLAEPFMAGIEMIHTHSLIHDDLPAIDNDDYRRGRLTSHKVYGEAMGILGGAALLNYAYETALKAGATGGKISGARGGGFMFFYCPNCTRFAVERALAELGVAAKRYEFTSNGLKTWTI